MQRPLQEIRIVDRLPRVGRGNERNYWNAQIHQVGINDYKHHWKVFGGGSGL